MGVNPQSYQTTLRLMLKRWRNSDRDSFHHAHEAFMELYAERLTQLVAAQPADLPTRQGAARAYKDILEIFNEVMRTS